MYKPSIYLRGSYLFSYLFTYIWDLFPTELVTKLKPNINWDEGVEIHPQPSNNGHPMDGVLVGAGSLWPVHSISPCQKINTRCAVGASECQFGRHHVAMSSMHRRHWNCPHPTKAHLHRQIRIIVVAPEAHFHGPFFASLDLDVRNIFAASHTELRWGCSNHLVPHLQKESLSVCSLSRALLLCEEFRKKQKRITPSSRAGASSSCCCKVGSTFCRSNCNNELLPTEEGGPGCFRSGLPT